MNAFHTDTITRARVNICRPCKAINAQYARSGRRSAAACVSVLEQKQHRFARRPNLTLHVSVWCGGISIACRPSQTVTLACVVVVQTRVAPTLSITCITGASRLRKIQRRTHYPFSTRSVTCRRITSQLICPCNARCLFKTTVGRTTWAAICYCRRRGWTGCGW